MASPAKIGISLLTLGSAGVATYGGITYFSQEKEVPKQGKSIKSLINEKFEYVLLDFTAGSKNKDERIWKTKWATYKSENTNKDKDALGLKNWNKTNPAELTEELKARCKELSEKLVYDEGQSNYADVTKYCGREATAEDEAIKNNLQIINGEGSDPWKDKIAKKDKLTSHLTKLTITDSQLTSDKIKPKCETAKAKQRKETGYKEFYESYKLICTNYPIPE